MAVFNAVDPVSVGLPTKADHYHRVFDNTLAIQEGSVALTQVTLDGLGAAPAVSPAGDAVVYYDTNENQLMVSQNAGAYAVLGQFLPNDPTFVGGTSFGFRG